MGRLVRVLVVVTACLGAAAPAPAELVDRVLAIVAGRVIMLSDVRGFLRLGLITPARAEDPEIETFDVVTSGSHRNPAVMAADAVRHVLVEVPFAVILPECDDMI